MGAKVRPLGKTLPSGKNLTIGLSNTQTFRFYSQFHLLSLEEIPSKFLSGYKDSGGRGEGERLSCHSAGTDQIKNGGLSSFSTETCFNFSPVFSMASPQPLLDWVFPSLDPLWSIFFQGWPSNPSANCQDGTRETA